MIDLIVDNKGQHYNLKVSMTDGSVMAITCDWWGVTEDIPGHWVFTEGDEMIVAVNMGIVKIIQSEVVYVEGKLEAVEDSE